KHATRSRASLAATIAGLKANCRSSTGTSLTSYSRICERQTAASARSTTVSRSPFCFLGRRLTSIPLNYAICEPSRAGRYECPQSRVAAVPQLRRLPSVERLRSHPQHRLPFLRSHSRYLLPALT